MSRLDAGLFQLPQQCAEVPRLTSRHIQIAASKCCGNNECPRLDAIRNNAVLGPVQLLDPLHADGRRARAFNSRAHLVQ